MSKKSTVTTSELASSIVLTIIYVVILILSLLSYFNVIKFSIASVDSVMLSTYCFAFMPLLLIFYSTSNFSIHKALRIIMFILGIGGSLALATFNSYATMSSNKNEFLSLLFVASPYVGCIAYGILFGYPRVSKSNGKIADIMCFIGESPILRALISILIIPLAIVIGVLAIVAFFIFIFLFLFSATKGGTSSDKRKNTVYVVNDGGYERKLTLFESGLKDYDTDSPGYQKLYSRFRDDLGNFWRTYDGNKTFIKEKYNGKIV